MKNRLCTSKLKMPLLMLGLIFSHCASAALLPEDPAVRDVKFSDRKIKVELNFFLKGYSLGQQLVPIDENRFLISMYESKPFRKTNYHNPKVVIVDIRNGQVTDTGYIGGAVCFEAGRIGIDHQEERTDYFGKLGEPLQKYPGGVGMYDDPATPDRHTHEIELNKYSCELVPHRNAPPHRRADGAMRNIWQPLRPEHGVIVGYLPPNSPGLALGFDANNRPAIVRTGGSEALMPEVYWEKPSGERINIPMNPGETIDQVRYLPSEKAYLLGNLILTTSMGAVDPSIPRFVRVLYPDGTIKKFGIPKVILEKVAEGRIMSFSYNKVGVFWSLLYQPHQPEINGMYVVNGNELVRYTTPGLIYINHLFDSCMRIGLVHTGSFFKGDTLKDFYYADLCKGENIETPNKNIAIPPHDIFTK